jgi:hypothetical protein
LSRSASETSRLNPPGRRVAIARLPAAKSSIIAVARINRDSKLLRDLRVCSFYSQDLTPLVSNANSRDVGSCLFVVGRRLCRNCVIHHCVFVLRGGCAIVPEHILAALARSRTRMHNPSPKMWFSTGVVTLGNAAWCRWPPPGADVKGRMRGVGSTTPAPEKRPR